MASLVGLALVMPSSLVRLAATTTPQKAWTAVGPEGVYINALAIDPQRPTTIFAGTRDHGVYKSTDGGRTWQAMNAGLTSSLVRAVAIDPITPATVYVGVSTTYRAMGGLFRSRDGGTNWHEIDMGSATFGGIGALAVDPRNPSVIYAGSSRGVFKSTDSGETWRLVKDRSIVSGLTIDPRNPATLYAVSRFDVLKTEDAGGNWRVVNSGLAPPNAYDINTLTIDPRTPTILFAATDGRGVFKSTDGGLSWRGVNAGLTDLRINVLAIDPQTPTTLYAGSWHGVFESRDGGGSWRAINGGLVDLSILALAIDPVTPTTLYAGTWGSGIFARDSVSGIRVPQRPKVAGSRAHPGSVTYLTLEKDGTVWLAIEIRGDLPAYAGSRSTIVFKKSSAGRTWEKILEVSGRGTLQRLWHFGSGGVLASFQGWPVGLVMRSTDGGVRWRSSPNLPMGEGVEGMSFVDPAEGWMLISLGAGMSKSYPALYHTLDGGDHWKEIVRVDPTSPGPPDTSGLGVEHKTGMEFHDTDNGWIGALSIVGMGYLYMSRDGGLTWKQQFLAPPKGMPDVNGSVLPPKFFGARTGVAVALLDGIAPHVYVTMDGGRSWGNPRQLPIKRSPDESGVWDFVSATTWAAPSNRTLWLSSNGGRTWLQRAIPLPPTHKVDRLVLAGPKTVWLIGSAVPPGGQRAIADYVLGTSDAGLHWTRVTLPEIP